MDNKLELLANGATSYLHFFSCPHCHKGSSKPPRKIWKRSNHRALISEISLSVIFEKSWQIREALGGCTLANFSPILQNGEKKWISQPETSPMTAVQNL